MTEVMKPFSCDREIELSKSADEVWEWLRDVRNTMCVNQFHASVEAGDGEPAVGNEFPIMHKLVPFPPHVRVARVTALNDDGPYAIAWAERHTLPFPDPFPHGESWFVTPVNSTSCRLTAGIRGAWTTPVGRAIGPYIWQAMFDTTLLKDLQYVGVAVGAIEHAEEIRPVPEHDRLHWLTLAHHINGQPAEEYLAGAAPVFGDYDTYMAEHPFVPPAL